MSPRLEHDEFSKHLNSKFRIRFDESQSVEIELAEVSELSTSARQARFSVVFRTSNEFFLGQGMRLLEHDVMGQFELMLVPIGRDESGTSYEAVFNRVINQS